MTSSLSLPTLILASSSPYRAALLKQLGLSFKTHSPDLDETPLPQEPPQQLVARLAEAKARKVGAKLPNALIIGADQVAVLNQSLLGKPGTHERALQQLRAASGQRVIFYTGLCLFNTITGQTRTAIEFFQVEFRQLTETQIEHYLQREKPYQCAGSFRSEGLGIALFKRLQGDDPSALIGLPLIRLTTFLEQEGYPIL
ncbi:septum formation protein Maf [Candidatus Nitrosoglobus terrae]|uniref:7-methyl-GTP pyrophosphatase n=1 Tax=Candidatus Nitrosoglobus terrae TaxID=1630141 RepID=A0A1Q2SNK5_9GAMM|nr:Maf family protein [Candidatus Nitrosoglobus terrae]BAW80735.1 septum formation protein Maf [Candidatus Nitrosoglobus terrae]